MTELKFRVWTDETDEIGPPKYNDKYRMKNIGQINFSISFLKKTYSHGKST